MYRLDELLPELCGIADIRDVDYDLFEAWLERVASTPG